MRERLAANNSKPFHLYCAIGGSEQQILLKGVGLLDQRGWPYSRIVMRLRRTSTERWTAQRQVNYLFIREARAMASDGRRTGTTSPPNQVLP